MNKLETCPFEEPAGQYEIVPEKKKKTRFEKITESPTALAMFLDQAVFQSFGLYSNFRDDIDAEYGYERNHFEEREDAILAWLKQEA